MSEAIIIENNKDYVNQLTEIIIGSAIEVHRTLGPGLLESAYEHCMHYELCSRNFPVMRQVEIPLNYKGRILDCGFRADMIVGNRVLVEIKSVASLADIHMAQAITYLKLTGLKLCLLINFNNTTLKQGIKRVVLNF